MNYTRQYKLQLIARNEGKIKAYESCCDVRAWSHDVRAQDQHLREWMKCDMPFCVLPVSLLTCFLRTMTCRSRRRVSPKCHPECKSKILVESICQSCEAVRECLEQDDNFDRYFVEEELETSHWPCDRCLEALKSVKMFWKIIMDKIFKINISKLEEETESSSCDSVKSIARVWQNDMIQQAIFVKSIMPALGTTRLARSSNETTNTSDRVVRSCPPTANPAKYGECSTKIPVYVKVDGKINKTNSNNKLHKSASIAVQVTKIGCDTCFIEKDNAILDAYKKNFEVLQDRCNIQNMEIDRLQDENTSLKLELENVYKSSNWKDTFYSSKYIDNNSLSQLPKPFECSLDDKSTNAADNVDSEMVITLKNFKTDFFKHVSLLQVLHKTNSPLREDLKQQPTRSEKDPLQILTKVKDTFGAIVKREMSIINEKPFSKNNDIEASFCRKKTHPCRSDPSCTTLSSRISSEVVKSSDISDNKIINTLNV